jgi:tetratricopeptide (TPR) repeat protein/O-antigen ligase
MLMALQGIVIFLTQSRGPQIGLLAGLLVFLAGMVYVVLRAWRRYAGSQARSRGALIGAASLAGLMVIAVLLAVVGAEVNILLAMLLGMVVYAMLVFGMILWANRERSRELAGAEVGFTGGAVALLLVGVLLIGAVLVVFNLPESPLAAYRSLPYVGRLGTLLQADEGTGKVRTLIWSGAEKMILDSPFRTLLGYGPEGMYVGYNRFYPPDLAHWELRNATPDRSHDFYIDQLVTMGIVGLAAYLLLAVAFFAYGLVLLRRSRTLTEHLIALGLLAMVTAHLVEGLTGIQIAATYTYFYMGLALLSVWGFYLTGYLRAPGPAVATVAAGNGAGGYDDAAILENGPLDSDGNGTEPILASTALAATVPGGKAAPRTNGHSTTPPPATARPPGSGAKGGKKGFTVVTPTPAPTGARRAAPPSTAAATAPPVPGARRPIPAGAATRAPRAGSRVVARTATVAARGLASPLLLVGYAVLTLIALWGIVGINVGNVKADMFYKQGLAYDNSGQWPGSIGPYARAISLAPNEDFYYLFLGRAYMEWAKNRSQFDAVLGAGQNPPAQTLLQLSEQALLRAKALNPMNTDHYANLGRLYSWWGSSDGGGDSTKISLAVQAYETAHRYSPGNAQLWNELGLAYYKAGRYQDAVDALHGSIAMDDRYALSYFVLGEIQRRDSVPRAAQDPAASARLAADAADAYAKAVLLDPSQIYDKDFQARVDWLSNTQTITPVIVAYQQVLSTTPDSTIASTALGYIYSSRNNLTGAIAEYEQAVSRQCGDFYSLQNLATVYNEVGRKADALAAYRKALAVATCNTSDPYASQCAALKTSCTPLLTSNPNMSDALNGVQLAISTLEKELNP